jgi:hypothetical protein
MPNFSKVCAKQAVRRCKVRVTRKKKKKKKKDQVGTAETCSHLATVTILRLHCFAMSDWNGRRGGQWCRKSIASQLLSTNCLATRFAVALCCDLIVKLVSAAR